MLSHDRIICKETNPESQGNSSDLFVLQIACNTLLNIVAVALRWRCVVVFILSVS